MATRVKIVKRNQPREAITALESDTQKSHEETTREMVRTIKSWVTELQDRKRRQPHSLPDFPVVAVLPEQIPGLSLAN